MPVGVRLNRETAPVRTKVIKDALLEALMRSDESPRFSVKPGYYILPRQAVGQELTIKGPYFELTSMGMVRNGFELATGKKSDMVVFSRTPFSASFNGARESGVLSSINGLIIPARTDVRILRDTEPGDFYVMKMSSYKFKPLSSQVPVGFRLDDFSSMLAMRESVLLMLPISTRGETVVTNGGIMQFDETSTPVVLSPDCQYFSVTNCAIQDFHYHNVLFEIYIPMGNATMFLAGIDKKGHARIRKADLKPGEAIIIPPKVVHYAVLDTEPTFVFKSSDVSIVDEKISVVEGVGVAELIAMHALTRK